ncbi:hypothetical protein MNBD_GAMMA12-495 [hydrothermal vent metagenome]|uniref:Uncharacterized protein n=1 Tax=hydrothermal vent metagenome TaxID=652676 RepID=A0A3B0YVN4_9ZZZZ
MTIEYIITKVQFNLSSDSRLYSLLNNINKRKRAYLVKRMLNEYLQIQDVLTTYNSNYNSKEVSNFVITDVDNNLNEEVPLTESIEYLLEDFSKSH